MQPRENESLSSGTSEEVETVAAVDDKIHLESFEFVPQVAGKHASLQSTAKGQIKTSVYAAAIKRALKKSGCLSIDEVVGVIHCTCCLCLESIY